MLNFTDEDTRGSISVRLIDVLAVETYYANSRQYMKIIMKYEEKSYSVTTYMQEKIMKLWKEQT